MNFKSLSVGITLAIGSAFSITSAAQAASLINFDTTVSYPGTPSPCVLGAVNAKCDIKLDSVTIDGKTVLADKLYKVTEANLIVNSNALTIGGVSADRGDNASGNPQESLLPGDPAANSKIVEFLGGSKPFFNMNNILDTEDNGSFVLDLVFDAGKAFNTVLFWERGMNSDIKVQALTKTGWETQLVTRNDWQSAGYSIDTTEIGGAQRVGAKGVQFSSDVLGVRLISKTGFNGPDFKLAATKVPEPATVASLGLVAGAMALSRRARRKQA
jgi:PEP-CTERM motif